MEGAELGTQAAERECLRAGNRAYRMDDLAGDGWMEGRNGNQIIQGR